MKLSLLSIAIATLVSATFSSVQAAPPDTKPSPSTPVQVMNGTGNPVPVTGTVTGTVNVSKTQTTALLEMIGLPMNFSTTTPLNTSQCSSLRVVLKSSGPSLLFQLTTPVGGNAVVGETEYFSTLVASNSEGTAVVDVPPPVTNVVMGISGNCPSCALGIYCR